MGAFIVAALVIAVLVADHIGPAPEVKRRFYQVGLGLVLAVLVVGIATLASPGPEGALGSSISFSAEEEENAAEQAVYAARERDIIVIGLAVIVAIAGLLLSTRLHTIYLGLLLGGAVLLVSALQASDVNSQIATLYGLTNGGTERNAAYVAVAGVGAALMLLYGYKEWEQRRAQSFGVTE